MDWPGCNIAGKYANTRYAPHDRRGKPLLLIIGGLNWGLVGIFSFDLVAWRCGGQGAVISRIVYILVALSAAWCISLLFRDTTSPEHA